MDFVQKKAQETVFDKIIRNRNNDILGMS
jgi:hypothetical protein